MDDGDSTYPPRNQALIDKADAAFTRRMATLKKRYGTESLWDIPKKDWEDAQRKRAEGYAEAHGRDPYSRERLYVPVARRATNRSPAQTERRVMQQVKAMISG